VSKHSKRFYAENEDGASFTEVCRLTAERDSLADALEVSQKGLKVLRALLDSAGLKGGLETTDSLWETNERLLKGLEP
jgi:hypothetical protein